MLTNEIIKREAEQIKEELISIRRELHRWPETAGTEVRTAAKIREVLTEAGIEWTEVCGTGTLGWLKRGEGTAALLRADIDALPMAEETGLPFASERPDAMHACGHDIHTTALLGAAKILAKHRKELDGTVYFAFQPGEEQGMGFAYVDRMMEFIEDMELRRPDRVFAFHVTPEAPAGHVQISRGADAAGCDQFKITFRGKSSHISKPHQGHLALYAVTEMAAALQRLQNEFVDPLESTLIGIGQIHGGTTWNIIPEEAFMEGTTRSFSMERADALEMRVRTMAEAYAGLHGCTAEVVFKRLTESIVNDRVEVEKTAQLGADLLGADRIHLMDTPAMGFGGDDFAAYLKKAPGIFVHIGTAMEGVPESSLPLHNHRIILSEEAILAGAEMGAAFVVNE